MRFLIKNYTSALCTEPMYLERCLNELGHDSKLWDAGSAFDAIDQYRPDIVLCHGSQIGHDLVKRLATSDAPSLIVNVTDLPQDQLDKLDELVKMANINVSFYYSNVPEFIREQKTDHPFYTILPAYDTFIVPPPQRQAEFDIKLGIVYNDPNEDFSFTENYENFHKIHLGGNDGDINTNMLNMVQIYDQYETLLIVGNARFCTSQIFFDAMARAKEVNIKCNNDQIFDHFMNKIFKPRVFKTNIAEELKSQIKQYHNSKQRATQLLSYLGAAEYDFTDSISDLQTDTEVFDVST